MLSRLAMDDIAALEARGIRLAPPEIVRLNALALRASRTAKAADIHACPRIGWAGNIAVHEPTLQADIWVDTCAARWFEGDEYASALLFACVHAVIPGFFIRHEMRSADACRAEMLAWQSTLTATETQLQTALEYALLGNDPADGETPAPKPPSPSNAQTLKPSNDQTSQTSPIHPSSFILHPSISTILTDHIDAAIAATLGLPLSDLMLLTETRLLSILRRWLRNRGETPADRSAVQAHADYARTLAAIIADHSSNASNDSNVQTSLPSPTPHPSSNVQTPQTSQTSPSPTV